MSINKQKPKIIVILGPTGSGKTGLGVKLAQKYDGEIVSADSRQVYRGMDIGTGKDLPDYTINFHNQQISIPYHLIDVAEPNDQYDLATYKKDAENAIADIVSRGKLPIIVGGTGLYLEALVDNFALSTVKTNCNLRNQAQLKSTNELFDEIKALNPNFADKINNSDRNNHRRLVRYLEVFSQNGSVMEKDEPIYQPLIIGLEWDKEELQVRIKRRLIERLEKHDMVEEVNNLNRQGVSWERLESFGLEYKFISWYLQEKIDYDQMVDKLYTAICQFAKRQMTWFRRWEKNGTKIIWLDSNQFDEAEKQINNFLK